MARNLQKDTERAIKDLHARELMRLGWYRQAGHGSHSMRHLRERKAQHQAFLQDLLRRRGVKQAWYARFFYLAGHAFGLGAALLPRRCAATLERTLEWWIFIRYERYLRKLKLHASIRSMIESLQLSKLSHPEPGPDVLSLLEDFCSEQQTLLRQYQLR